LLDSLLQEMIITKSLCALCQKNMLNNVGQSLHGVRHIVRPDVRLIVRPVVQSLLRQSLRHRSTSIAAPLRPIKGKSEFKYSSRFVDWKEVRVYGGKGGDGRISFKSVYMVEFAGPDGGDGGHGGHVLFSADPKVKDLSKVDTVIQAHHGTPGGLDNMEGKDAKHRIVPVPVGTMIKNVRGEIVCDLAKAESMFLAAKGGAGGKGNVSFKNSVNQCPKVAEMGAKGEIFIYNLELRTMADVGLIGFPNAGKSTLLQAISRARPKVAAYPFTTINPHIGMVPYDDLTQLAVADLPGLIRGSSKNKGLGFSFLQHVQRCQLLLYVIDLSAEDPLDQLDALMEELEEYKPGLSDRPAAVVANKIDLPYSEQILEHLKKESGLEVMLISGKTGVGLTHMLTRIKQLSDQYRIESEEIENSN